MYTSETESSECDSSKSFNSSFSKVYIVHVFGIFWRGVVGLYKNCKAYYSTSSQAVELHFQFHPYLGGIDPIRLIFFGWVETTNYRKQMQLMHSHCVSFLPVPRSCFSFVMYVWANTKLTNLSEKIQVLRRYNFMRPVSVVNKYAYDAVLL